MPGSALRLTAAICLVGAVACAGGTSEKEGPPTVQVAVTPHTASAAAGGAATFSAEVTGTSDLRVTWTVQEGDAGGTVVGGVYTAPGTTGTFHVVATSVADPTRSDAATVTVVAAPVVQVVVAPATASVVAGGSATFSAEVTGTADARVTWSVQEGAAGGSVTDGVYTAPATPGTYHVVATSVADGTRSDRADVTVTAAPVVHVVVAPATASVVAGGSATFSATVTGTADRRVAWSVQEGAAGGSVADGVYTAPATPGAYHVVATSVADATKSGRAEVTVTASPTTLAAQLSVLSGKAIYFGHQSVGENIMAGVRKLLADNTGPEPTVVTTSSAARMGPGIWAEAGNGSNYDPAGKVTAFRTTLEGGVGARVNLAFMKFCWVDFDDGARWFQNGGTVAGLFTQYQAAMAALRSAYPSVTLVHLTAPLYTDTPRNAQREEYNALVRSAYQGVEPVFDLALLESTDPSGNRVVGTYGPALYAGYTSDGGHLNATGQELVARALVALLAGL